MIRRRSMIALWVVLALIGSPACQRGRSDENNPGGEAGPATRNSGDPFSVMAMVHAAEAGAPADAPGPPVPTIKWDGRKGGGPFSYSSVRCIDPAPINDVSTNLTTFSGRLPDSFSPASIRLQPIEFRVVQGGDAGRLEGTINMVACGLSPGRFSRVAENTEGPDTNRDKITISWGADYKRTSKASAQSPNAGEVSWIGRFSITGGTGRYQGINGSGHISGNFLCLQGAGGCSGPDYTDGQVVMAGTYNPPGLPSQPPA